MLNKNSCLAQTLGVTCGLYYNPLTIVNDDARVVSKLETHLLTLLES